MTDARLLTTPPRQLEAARELSHAAVQWPSRAARANLPAAPDDRHSNLAWDEASAALLSRELDTRRRCQLGFSFRSFSLLWLEGGVVQDTLPLMQCTEPEVQAWCDARLSAAGLQRTGSAEMPYSLDAVDYRDFAGAASPAELEALGAWYSSAQTALAGLVVQFGDHAIAAPEIRCWPHHYDLGTLFALEAGDPETSRSVGVGLSPGDGSYAEPYFYCTPWPTPSARPAAPAPMHWHTQGFTSLVLTASNLRKDTAVNMVLAEAFSLALQSLASR